MNFFFGKMRAFSSHIMIPHQIVISVIIVFLTILSAAISGGISCLLHLPTTGGNAISRTGIWTIPKSIISDLFLNIQFPFLNIQTVSIIKTLLLK
jgi:hypothetical protein